MLTLPKYTFLNGPPGCGKSTLASLLTSSNSDIWRESFAEPIRSMMYSVFFPEEGPISFDFDLRDAEVKKRLFPFSGALSMRDVMISFSEEWMKPKFGTSIFGQLALKRCKEQEIFYEKFILDDAGFTDEVAYIASMEGAENCLLISLKRAGCSFSGDSRSYIEVPGIRRLELHNNSSEAANMLGELELLLEGISL